MRYLTKIIITFFLASCMQFLHAQNALPVTGDNLISALGKNEGKYYALIIGINNYRDPLINDSDKPINDLEQLITKQQGFNSGFWWSICSG